MTVLNYSEQVNIFLFQVVGALSAFRRSMISTVVIF